MDYKKKYEELKKQNKLLTADLDNLRSKESGGKGPKGTMVSFAFQSASQIMALMNMKTGLLIDVNEAFLKILGYTRKEVLGKTSDEIGLYADIEESSKYLRLVSRLKRIRDFVISLKTKTGEVKAFLFSAETMQYENETYLMMIFNPIASRSDLKISQSQGNVLEEIFNTVTSYLALFRVGDDNRFYIIDVNSKVEEVEFIDKNDLTGKCIDDTPLANRIKIKELLEHLRITHEAHKMAASPSGDESEGFYMGFILTSGNILITWEPSGQQKKQDDYYKQNLAFEEIADWMPVMVYEVDINGKVLYGNKQGLDFFGYTKEDLESGLLISNIFPESYKQIIGNLAALKSPGEISSNEYLGKRKDGTLVPIVTHTFATFHDGKITGYRGTINDMSRQKAYEEQIRREKAFLEHLIDSTPEAIAITDLEGKITLINREFTNIFGYTLEESADKFIDDLVVPIESKDDSVSQKTLAAQGKAVAKQTIRKDKSGNRIQMTVTGTPIVVNNETVAYLGIYRDITTERKNQLLQEILYNISNAALKQMDIKEMYPTIVKELSKIWDTNNFFIALYDETNDTLSLPFFADEKDNFYEIPTTKTITGYVIKNNKSVLLKENDLRLLEESGDIDLIGTPCKVWMGVPLKVENSIIGVMCLQDYDNAEKFSQDDLYVLDFIANQIAIAIQRRMILDNLIVARQKAEEAAQSKQIFMSTMSHEIRTPLNEVIGITNLLLQGNRSDSPGTIS
jgi:PAS domain S-box-containing protein